MTYDVFISHASEDKDPFVRNLAKLLRDAGLNVWYDEFSLKVGDSLAESIDRGLSESRFGLVILSPNFFAKHWTRWELNGLVARQTSGGPSVILPIWHDVSHDDVVNYSPPLADLVALNSATGPDELIPKLVETIKPELSDRWRTVNERYRQMHSREAILEEAIQSVFDEAPNGILHSLVEQEHFHVNFRGHIEIAGRRSGPWDGEILVVYEPSEQPPRHDDWRFNRAIDSYYFDSLSDLPYNLPMELAINFLVLMDTEVDCPYQAVGSSGRVYVDDYDRDRRKEDIAPFLVVLDLWKLEDPDAIVALMEEAKQLFSATAEWNLQNLKGFHTYPPS